MIDESLKDEVRVTVIATGFSGDRNMRRSEPEAHGDEVEIKPFTNDDLDIPAFLRRRT